MQMQIKYQSEWTFSDWLVVTKFPIIALLNSNKFTHKSSLIFLQKMHLKVIWCDHSFAMANYLFVLRLQCGDLQ